MWILIKHMNIHSRIKPSSPVYVCDKDSIILVSKTTPIRGHTPSGPLIPLVRPPSSGGVTPPHWSCVWHSGCLDPKKILSTIDPPPGVPGVSKNHIFFSQMKVFSFCAKIAPKRHKLKKNMGCVIEGCGIVGCGIKGHAPPPHMTNEGE